MPVVSEEQRIKIETKRALALIQQKGTEVKQKANEQVKTLHEVVIEGRQELESKYAVMISKVEERIYDAGAKALEAKTYTQFMKNEMMKMEEAVKHWMKQLDERIVVAQELVNTLISITVTKKRALESEEGAGTPNKKIAVASVVASTAGMKNATAVTVTPGRVTNPYARQNVAAKANVEDEFGDEAFAEELAKQEDSENVAAAALLMQASEVDEHFETSLEMQASEVVEHVEASLESID